LFSPRSAFMIICRSLRRTGVCSNAELSSCQSSPRMMGSVTNGDLNNTAAERVRAEITTDAAYRDRSLAIPSSQDEALVRKTYRPFLLDDAYSDQDWVARLELSTALKMVDLQVLRSGGDRLKVLVLHGSMRKR
jgi:arsenic resistance protein ArsH